MADAKVSDLEAISSIDDTDLLYIVDVDEANTSHKMTVAAFKAALITKANIEAQLTGEITSHSHPGSGGGAALWQEIAAERTNDNTLSAEDIQLTLTAGTLVRTANAEAKPTDPASWKYHVVKTEGSGSVDIIGEVLATGAETFFAEYCPSNIYLRVIPLHVAGFWAAATGNTMLETIMGMKGGFVWREKAGRVIAATHVTRTDDSGETAATANVKVNASDLMSTAFSVTDAVADTAVGATARAIAWGQSIELSCAATGTNKDSVDMAVVLFAVILEG
jgi:hypothetical protein